MRTDIYWGISHNEFYRAVKQFAERAIKDDECWNGMCLCTQPLKEKVRIMMEAYLSVYATRKTKSKNGDIQRAPYWDNRKCCIIEGQSPHDYRPAIDQRYDMITNSQAGYWIKKVLPLPV